MISWDLVAKLMNCFPNSVINQNEEFIAHIRSNTYFILKDCNNEIFGLFKDYKKAKVFSERFDNNCIVTSIVTDLIEGVTENV